jgi:uncharacterized protein YceK
MRNITIVIGLAAILSGCGVARMNQAANDYQASVAAYKQCLDEYPESQCEGKRLAMEADERQYNNRASAISGHQGAVSINSQSR